MGSPSSGSLGPTSTQGRVQNSIPSSPSSVISPNRLPFVSGQQGEVPCSPGGSDQHAREKCSGNRTGGHPRVLQPAILGTESLRSVETCVGRVSSQQICNKDQVLHGDHPVGPGFDSEGRLDGLHGHEGCLLPCTHPQGFQEVPEVFFRRESFSVQGSVFRPEHSPSGLYQGAGSSCKNCPSGRLPDNSVLRRLADHRSLEGASVESERIRNEPSSGARNYNKFRKVLFSAKAGKRVFRHDYRLRTFLGFPHQETNRFRATNIRRISVLSREAGKVLASLARTYVFPREIRAGVPSTNETAPVPSEQVLGQSKSEDLDSDSRRPERGSLVVVRTSENNQGPSTSKAEPRPEVVLRCLSRRLGSHPGRATPVRKVVRFGEVRTHQYVRAESHLASPERGRSSSSEQSNRCLRGQHDRSGLHYQTRGNKILDAIPPSSENLPLAGREWSDPHSSVHPRDKEHSGGFPQQEGTDITKRMDVTSGGLSRNLEMVGKAYGGLVRHQPDEEASSIYVPTCRPDGDSNRLHVAKLVQHGRLCFPSIRHDTQSDQQISDQLKLQTNSYSSMVATEGVVPGPYVPGVRASSSAATQTRPADSTLGQGKAQKPPHSSTCRMETLQRLTKYKELSKQVSKAIYESRKPSTNTLYQKRWATFVNWCRSKKLSASRPSINSICEFFIFLFEVKGLVVNTIRCYRSTLHSVLRHTGLRINRDEDISDVIRALKLRSPVSNPRTVHWNLDVLLNFLCGERFEPLSQCSILNLTRKTFILLALALSKRISELQALSRAVGFCKEGALVSLSLDFRAKNDFKCKGLDRNFLVKELGSLVGQEEEALLCPVRALKWYLERTKPLVGDNMSRLFVSPRFPKNPASKNALTSMTKAVIREAHESLRPDLVPILKVKAHELRGVSTSLAFERNLSLQKVMEAAQWRCHSVFASHYLKDISFNYDDCRTLGPLLVAGSVIT